MKRASTFRLHEDVQAGLDLVSQLQHRPKNKLVNEAVAEYVTRHTRQAEGILRDTLERLRAYQKEDPGFEAAIDKFVEAEAKHGNLGPSEEVNATLSDLVAGTNSRTAAREHLAHLRARRQETSAAPSRLPGNSK